MKEHMKKFKEIFEQENLSEAINYINHLKSNLNDFPKFLQCCQLELKFFL